MKIVIIGGVAAGMSAAAKARRMDEKAEIIVYEKGGDLSYAACGLPYYVADITNDFHDLIVRTKEEFEASNIQCYLNHEVICVDVENRTIQVKDIRKDTIISNNYDKLMVATGASPIMPPIEGSDLGRICTLKTLQDGIQLKPLIMDEAIQDITIIGGGYIGIEVAENLIQLGKSVRIIEMADRILMPFDKEISDYAYDALIEKGVCIHLNEKVVKLKDENQDKQVDQVLTDGGTYKTDLVVMSVGIKPDTDFLDATNFKKLDNGALIVDQEMRTSAENVYAAGDCATVYHFQKKEAAYFPLGTTANKCGKLVGINLTGGHEKFVGAIGAAAIKVLDYELARIGITEEEGKSLGYNAASKIIKTNNRPKYYKGNSEIVFKLIYDQDTMKILGAQGVGKQDVVLRINQFSVAIYSGMTADALGMVDFCYAPPFSSAWDAVHIAANVIS